MKGFVFFVLAILPLLSYGQTEPADSVDIDLLPDNPEMMTPRLEGMASGINLDSLSYSRRLFLYGPGHRFDYGAPELKYAPGETTLFAMPGARFIATGATTTMPGLMTVNSGAIGITGQIDNLSLYAGAIANKYGYYLGVHNQYWGQCHDVVCVFTRYVGYTLWVILFRQSACTGWRIAVASRNDRVLCHLEVWRIYGLSD